VVDERRAERQIMGRPQVSFDTIATISGMPIKDGDAIAGVGLDRISSSGDTERQKIVNSYDGWETDV